MAGKNKFAIGIDYGTEEAGAAIVPYPHGVIDDWLPGGPKLEHDWALQNPREYLLVVEKGVPRALKAAGVKGDAVIGLGYGLYRIDAYAHPAR